jgi:hypothetical protein
MQIAMQGAIISIKKHVLNNKYIASSMKLKPYLDQTKEICSMQDPYSKCKDVQRLTEFYQVALQDRMGIRV